MALDVQDKEILTYEKLDEWYTAWGGQCYVSFSGGKDSTVLAYPGFPIVPLKNGKNCRSELRGRRNTVDALDLACSNMVNNVDEGNLIYWVLTNAGGMKDLDDVKFLERIKTLHVAHTDDEVNAEPHTIEAPFEGTNATIDMLKRKLYEDFQAFDSAAVSAGNQTATAIKASYVPLDLKVDDFESDVTDFIQGLLTLAGADDTPSYTRSQIVNKSEETQTVLMGAEYYDDEYITKKLLTINGDIDQYDELMRRKDAEELTVLPYSPPAINSFSAWRITSGGAASDDGNRVAVKMNYAVASVGGKNDRTYRLKYKKSGDESFTQFASGTASTAYDDTQTFTSAPDISVDYAYIIRLELTDYFQTVAYEVQLPTAFTIMDFRHTGRGMAIGKVSEKDALEVAMDVEFSGGVTVNNKTLLDWLHPVGSIYQSTVDTDPGELFGGTWERIKDRFLLAAGDTFSAGKTGGEASHTLTVDEIPDHTHSYQYTGQSTVIGTDTIRLYDRNGQPNQYTGQQSSNCGGKAHNNMPPYLTVYMWKRTE